MIFRAVETDGKSFEKKISVETGEGNDDVLLDSSEFGFVHVNGGNDNVLVTAGGSLVSGGEGDDVVTGGDNTDILGGGAGDDTLDGGGAVDILNGDDGNDVLLDSSTQGENCLSGGGDADQIVDGNGADYLNGDEPFCGATAIRDPLADGGTNGGKDAIVTGGGADVVVAGNENDEVKLFQGNVKAIFEPADPVWDAGETVYGNGGADHIKTRGRRRLDPWWIGGRHHRGRRRAKRRPCAAKRWPRHDLTAESTKTPSTPATAMTPSTATTASTSAPCRSSASRRRWIAVGAADTVRGGDGADQIALEAGDDRARGGGGGDAICGHAGVDTIDGGDDDSSFLPVGGTGDGDDTVFGGTAGDTIKGGPGADELYGNAGVDTMNGDDNADRMVGGSSRPGRTTPATRSTATTAST